MSYLEDATDSRSEDETDSGSEDDEIAQQGAAAATLAAGLSIKLVIDTKSQKVRFAEAGTDVVEFLTGLLSLPLGTVVDLLTKEHMVGSIGNVLGSVEKMDAGYKGKERRLSPAVGPAALSRLQQLLSRHLNNGRTCHCTSSMNNAITRAAAGTSTTASLPTATYTVGDDLSVTPASFFSTMSLLGIRQFAQFGGEDLSGLQEKTVKIGKEEALRILAASLKSKTVLTDVFLKSQE
ncbi:hypothetical protein CFC21_039971 [Triticum aestivum]|uniref:DUF674 domain-containing protein n=3 Tax=Triticum aestivum TaxID=4565 RepID=A0A9R1FGH6_WHEAT|nr:hypothetical protein CFC21_039971 [Triticum aestivum]CDM81394.1 unnamed protein product [Triticum aestivum]